MIDLDNVDEYHVRCRGSKREQARPPICAAGWRAHRCAGCRGDRSNAALDARVRPDRQYSYGCRGSCSGPCQAGAAPPGRAISASFSVSWASWASTTTPSNAPSSLSGVDAVEWKPCAQWSPPGQYRSPCPQRRVRCVVGHWHAIVIGRPADRGSVPHDQRIWRRSRARATESPPEIVPAPGISSQSQVRFRSGHCEDRNGMVPALLPGSLLFYFCQLIRHVCLLVFLLVSATIDDKNLCKFR